MMVEGFFLVFGEIGVATEDSGNHGTIAGGGEGLVEGVAGAEGSGLGTRGGVGLVLAADSGEELVQIVNDLKLRHGFCSLVGD